MRSIGGRRSEHPLLGGDRSFSVTSRSSLVSPGSANSNVVPVLYYTYYIEVFTVSFIIYHSCTAVPAPGVHAF